MSSKLTNESVKVSRVVADKPGNNCCEGKYSCKTIPGFSTRPYGNFKKQTTSIPLKDPREALNRLAQNEWTTLLIKTLLGMKLSS